MSLDKRQVFAYQSSSISSEASLLFVPLRLDDIALKNIQEKILGCDNAICSHSGYMDEFMLQKQSSVASQNGTKNKLYSQRESPFKLLKLERQLNEKMEITQVELQKLKGLVTKERKTKADIQKLQKLLSTINQRLKTNKITLNHNMDLAITKKEEQEDRMLGGGGCTNSRTQQVQQPSSLTDLNDEVRLKKQVVVSKNLAETKQIKKVTRTTGKITGDFLTTYNAYIVDPARKQETIDQQYEIAEMHSIFANCVNQHRQYISVKIELYRTYILEIFDTFLQYMILSAERDSSLTEDIQELGNQLKVFHQYILQRVSTHQCLDLAFLTQFLMVLNEQRVGLDEKNKPQVLKIIKVITIIAKLGVNIASIATGVGAFAQALNQLLGEGPDIIDQIKTIAKAAQSIFEGTMGAIQYNNEMQNVLNKELMIKELASLTVQKVEFLGEKKNASFEDEIAFYIDKLIEFTNSKGSCYFVLYIMTQINYLLEKGGLGLNRKEQKCKDFAGRLAVTFPLSDAKVQNFINILQQKSNQKKFYESALEFFKFSVFDPTYRFLANQILLKFKIVVDHSRATQEEKENFSLHLLYSYVTEKNDSVKVVFINNADFVDFFNERVQKEQDELARKLMKTQQERNSDFLSNGITTEELGKIADLIKNEKDLFNKIALKLIEKWELDAKNRYEKDIALKDDALLEVQDLYINQRISFLEGKNIISDNKKNAIELILADFLKPNYQGIPLNQDQKQKQKEGKNNKQVENKEAQNKKQTCRILAILAEGGTGKSMLIKKLETTLIKLRNDQQQNLNFIPLIVKCNSLDAEAPSLEQYFYNQKLSKSQVDALQKSDRNKLILLDGYDEYSGKYFRIYEQLNLQKWNNTLVIASSRKEKLSDQEACSYFSIDNEEKQQDYFTIVKLEEFQRKEIDEYCQKYFKKCRTDENNEVNEELVKKDQEMMNICLQNNQLENLLQIPINLYLFTRMIVIKDEVELKELVKNISDQIQIQEVFFQQQFHREAIDFSLQVKSKGNLKELQSLLASAYFEYFQTIAMLMLIKKGKTANYLQVKKEDIQFKLNEQLTKLLSKDFQTQLINKITSYVNSKIITRVKEDQGYNNDSSFQDNTVEFKHKSLFEYFAARAMKFDFDVYGDEIHSLPIEKLKEFSINKKSIMNIGQNQSEQQVLLKFYKMIASDIQTETFIKTYYKSDIKQIPRYIQYIQRSKIADSSQISQIDTGASNMLSTLFVSKFQFAYLNFTLCSFSKAYIPQFKDPSLTLNSCNLSSAYLKGSNLNFEASNTEGAYFDSFQKVYDIGDTYNFSKIQLLKDNLAYSINQNGFLNCFEIKDKAYKLIKSKRITNTGLTNMKFQKDLFVISSELTLFLIDITTFEILNSKAFDSKIIDISLSDKKEIYSLLEDGSLYVANFDFNFTKLEETAEFISVSPNGEHLAIIQGSSLKILDSKQSYSLVKKIDQNLTLCCYSYDGKYLAAVSNDRSNECLIFNCAKKFDKAATVKDNSDINSLGFSTDSKYLVYSTYEKSVKLCNTTLPGFKNAFKIENVKSEIINVSLSVSNKLIAVCTVTGCEFYSQDQNSFSHNLNIQAHTDSVKSLAYEPASKHFATGSRDDSIKIWKLNVNKKNSSSPIDLEEIVVINEHRSEVCSLAYSPDGRYLASGSNDGTCKLWNAKENYSFIRQIQEYADSVVALSFSPDGKYLAAGNTKHTCCIFSTENNFEQVVELQDHTFWLTSLSFSPDGEYLCTGANDNSFALYEVSNNFKLKQRVDGLEGNVSCVRFSDDGQLLAIGLDISSDSIKIYRMGEEVEELKTLNIEFNITTLAFSPGGRYLVAGTSEKTCKVFNVEKNYELESTINDHTELINQVLFISDVFMISCSNDKSFKIWNTSKGFEKLKYEGDSISDVTSISFSSNSNYLATASQETCSIWNTEKGYTLEKQFKAEDEMRRVAFSKKGKYLATIQNTVMLHIYDAENNYSPIKQFRAHDKTITLLRFSFDDKYIITGSHDKTLKIWNVEKGFVMEKSLEKQMIDDGQFSPNSKYLAVCTGDKTCKILNPSKGFEVITQLQDFKQIVKTVSFSPDGRYLATGSQDRTCKIWECEKGFALIKTMNMPAAWIITLAFSMDNFYLITTHADETMKFWYVQKDFELAQTISANTKNVYGIEFTTNNKCFATYSENKLCQIWNISPEFEIQSNYQNNKGKQTSMSQKESNNSVKELIYNLYTL